MFRIQDESNHEIVINKSRFICYLKRVDNEQDAKDYIKHIKKMHPKATHHCQAILINDLIQRSNDDGEPSGTAGIPMLEVLRKQQMEHIVAVVVRYFGGILLGAGGLVRAYSKSVSDALSHTTRFQIIQTKCFQITFDYSYIDKIEYHLKDTLILDKHYNETVTYHFATNHDKIITSFSELTNGRYLPQYTKTIELEQAV